jgi:hypothetical protein
LISFSRTLVSAPNSAALGHHQRPHEVAEMGGEDLELVQVRDNGIGIAPRRFPE